MDLINASGHASVGDLQRLAKAAAAAAVVPIHTSRPDRFAELFANCSDGEWWDV
jgi:ribonuclease J